MKDFGFRVLKEEVINYDRQDLRLARILIAEEPSITLCIGCGSCSGTCSTAHFTEFNIRKIHTLVRRGDTSTLKATLQHCMFCGKCQLVCPRGVNLRNVILTIHKAIGQIG